MGITINNKRYLKEGGPNSGYYGHAGRPGQEGGSSPGGGSGNEAPRQHGAPRTYYGRISKGPGVSRHSTASLDAKQFDANRSMRDLATIKKFTNPKGAAKERLMKRISRFGKVMMMAKSGMKDRGVMPSRLAWGENTLGNMFTLDETRVGKKALKMSSGEIRHFKSVKKLKNFERVAQAYKHGWKPTGKPAKGK